MIVKVEKYENMWSAKIVVGCIFSFKRCSDIIFSLIFSPFCVWGSCSSNPLREPLQLFPKFTRFSNPYCRVGGWKSDTNLNFKKLKKNLQICVKFQLNNSFNLPT